MIKVYSWQNHRQTGNFPASHVLSDTGGYPPFPLLSAQQDKISANNPTNHPNPRIATEYLEKSSWRVTQTPPKKQHQI
jgi:hypothetical protein